MIRFVDVHVVRAYSKHDEYIEYSEPQRQTVNVDHIIRIGCDKNDEYSIIYLTKGTLHCKETQATVILNIHGADLPI